MQKYSVIVFDLGNVLIPFDYAPLIQKFNGIRKNLGDEFAKFYEENYEIHRNYERGQISSNDFIAKMLKVLDHKVTPDEFCGLFSSVFTVNEKVVELLPRLKKDYTLILLSNTNEIHRKYGWQKYEFLNQFEKLILSYEVGSVKPEEKIYRSAEKFSGRPSSEHFFIDDIAQYVEGAIKCGWGGVQFIDYESLVKELKRQEIL
ncbi:MAG: HAD family phosphatase [Ignavibacteriae bacterium HGW-Ignavibacteriae-3]|nr:MAG: HAD family phosphatase [Ignavibacteriae bacterium HGW-Ignavibacteriae-3]